MADHDSDTPKDKPRVVPDPHRGEPAPPPDAHTRPDAADADAVRPDQQEEIGPVEGLLHTAAVEAAGEVTGDPEVEAEAARLGVEGEGVEAAQIFGLMLATVVALGLAVVGVFVLVAWYADSERVARDAVGLYPELREVELVREEMRHYNRTDTLYRLPIGAAMGQVAAAYYARQAGEAVPAPAHFNTVYLNTAREAGVPLWEEREQDAAETPEAETLPTEAPQTDGAAPAVEGAELAPAPTADGDAPDEN